MSRPSSRTRFKHSRIDRLRNWWWRWRILLLAVIVTAVWWFGFRPIATEQDWTRVSEQFAICGGGHGSSAGCVVDGDTVVIGFGGARRRIRLTGFDAPEIEGACEAEREQALRARDYLYRWLERGAVEWDGGGDPPRDQYGRELRAARRALSDGKFEYLADVMIDEGLAADNGWGYAPLDWCE